MNRILVVDSLYCPEAFFCSHADSYGHYLAEALPDSSITTRIWQEPNPRRGLDWHSYALALVLDRYERAETIKAEKRIAQVAAICSPMPWDVRKSDGSPAYDCVISSIPWMVEVARAAGCRAEYMPLAFDTRARVCGMGVKRDLGCIFVGTVGPNHHGRGQILEELKDVVTVMPTVFGREYFRTLARAKVVVNIHAEWSRGVKNNMRLFEASGMGAVVVTDGREPKGIELPGNYLDACPTGMRLGIKQAIALTDDDRTVAAMTELALREHTYESRIPRLVEIARSL